MSKREKQKRLVDAALPMLDLPSSTTREGHAEYIRVKRQLERIAVKEPFSLREFWLHYDASLRELQKLEAFGLLSRKKKS